MTRTHASRTAPYVGAVLLTALALLAPIWPEARVAVAVGAVELGRGEPPAWQPAAAGDALAPGDRVRTGEDGRPELALGDATLRLYPNSLLRLPEAGPAAVELDGGSSLFDVLRRGAPFEVRTPEVVVSVKGTRFAVDLGAEDAAVSVFRGLVGVRDGASQAENEVLVQAGFSANRALELSWHGATDPWEGWSRGEAMRELDLGRAVRRDAALRDARAAALDMARELPPAARAPDGEPRPERRHDAESDAAESPKEAGEGKVPRDRLQKLHDDSALEIRLKEKFVETIVNSPTGGSTTGGGLLEIVFLDGSGRSGDDAVQILSGSDVWTFDEDEVEEVLEGDSSLPANLLALIEQQGLDEATLAIQLMRFFEDD
jgi:hypothetical protein